MKIRFENALVLALAAASFLPAQTPANPKASLMLGTWEFNPAKSQFGGPAPRTVSTFEPWQGAVRLTTDTVSGQGQAGHIEWVGQFDGKDYPLKGTPNAGSRAFKRVDDHNYERTDKKDRQVVASERIVIAANGKSRTTYTALKDPPGKTMNVTAVFDLR